MRSSSWVAILMASHGAALWLGSASPRAAEDSAAASAAPAREPGVDRPRLASFLREAESEVVEPEPDYDEQVEALRSAITPDVDVEQMVRSGAADPDQVVSEQTVAAFSIWVDRDPVAALRWFGDWWRDASSSWMLEEVFSGHLEEGGFHQLHRYLDAVPAARAFLLERGGNIANQIEPEMVIAVAAKITSVRDRLNLLESRFGKIESVQGQLASIRALLDDSAASAFIGDLEIGQEAAWVEDELREAGFPEYSIRQYLAEREQRKGQARTNTDFMGTNIIGVVDGPGEPGIVTSSGLEETSLAYHGPINRNNIDAILDASDQAQSKTSEKAIRKHCGENFAIDREDFLRGRISADEWLARIRAAVPGGEGLSTEIAVLAACSCLHVDPRRAAEIGAGMTPVWDRVMEESPITGFLSPEVVLSLATRVSGPDGISPAMAEVVEDEFRHWAGKDFETCAGFVREMRAGSMKEILLEVIGEGRE